MSLNPLSGWSRLGSSGLVVLALVLAAAWRSPVAGPPVVDVGDLVAEPEAHLGSGVVVTGEWEMTAPTQRGYMVAVLRGRDGGRVACHFEDVPTADRNGLDTYLLRTREVVVFGRCDGVEAGRAVLRDCRLID
ncbi:MAG TPA: hypothetical protein VFG68_06850 [Fimbriiglobus sp.]|nr:hypothetical protein [Fimbriiglobus sp.]